MRRWFSYFKITVRRLSAGALVLLIGVLAIIVVGTANISHFWRAWQSTISSMGTTRLGIIPLCAVFIYLCVQAYRRSGIAGLKERWRDEIKGGLLIVLAIWSSVFLWYLAFPEPEIFTAEEIQGFAHAATVVIVTDERNPKIVGMGVWADNQGYALTALRKASTTNDDMAIGVLIPFFMGKVLATGGGVIYTRGEPIHYDPDTGVQVVRVHNNPFTRGPVSIEAEDNVTGAKDVMSEKHDIPTRFNGLVSVGTSVFLAGAEERSSQKGDPVIFLREGRVVRIGDEHSASGQNIRLFTDIPFVPSFRGAPVFNSSKLLVGLVAPTLSGNVVVIPSQYLEASLQKARPKMTPIPCELGPKFCIH